MKTVKCVVVGDGAVGKTCLLISYTTNKFPSDYVPTIFDNYDVAVAVRDEPYKLSLYDTAGQPEFNDIRPLAYSQTDVFVVCFSVGIPDSFDSVKERWIPEIKQRCPNVPFVLVGTQSDLRKDAATIRNLAVYKQEPKTPKQGKQLAKDIKAVKYLECCAMTREGLSNVFQEAIIATLETPQSDRCLPSFCSVV